VFAALIDVEVLRRCIPGCESLTEVAPDRFEAALKLGVAGLSGRYTGKAEIRDKRPPEALTLAFEGKGSSGFVRGSAVVTLAAADAAAADQGTRVLSDGDVQVGGLIAAVGSRLIEAAARKLTDDFFRRLAGELASTP
jgi:carbon monoxide dehydrogenase subunit G